MNKYQLSDQWRTSIVVTYEPQLRWLCASLLFTYWGMISVTFLVSVHTVILKYMLWYAWTSDLTVMLPAGG